MSAVYQKMQQQQPEGEIKETKKERQDYSLQRIDAVRQLASKIQTCNSEIEVLKTAINKNQNDETKDILATEIEQLSKRIDDFTDELRNLREDLKEEMLCLIEDTVIEKINETPREDPLIGAKIEDIIKRLSQLEENKPKIYLRNGRKEPVPPINKINEVKK